MEQLDIDVYNLSDI